MSTRKKPWRRNYTFELAAVTKPPVPPLSNRALVRSAEISLEAVQSASLQLRKHLAMTPYLAHRTDKHLATLRVTLATLKKKIKRRQAAGIVITNLVTNAAIALTVTVVSVSFTNYHPSGTEMHVTTVVSKEHWVRYRASGKPEAIKKIEPVSTNVQRFVAKVTWTEVPLRPARSLMGVPDLPPLPAGLRPGILNANKP